MIDKDLLKRLAKGQDVDPREVLGEGWKPLVVSGSLAGGTVQWSLSIPDTIGPPEDVAEAMMSVTMRCLLAAMTMPPAGEVLFEFLAAFDQANEKLADELGKAILAEDN